MRKYTGIELMETATVGTAIIRQAMVITIGRQLLFFLPLLYLLNYIFGFNGFIWAQPAADILTTDIAVVLSRPLFRIMWGK